MDRAVLSPLLDCCPCLRKGDEIRLRDSLRGAPPLCPRETHPAEADERQNDESIARGIILGLRTRPQRCLHE